MKIMTQYSLLDRFYSLYEIPMHQQEWHKWFAWYPVFTGDSYVWLDYVNRCGAYDEGLAYWKYKAIVSP